MLLSRFVFGTLFLLFTASALAGCGASTSADASQSAAYPTAAPSPVAPEEATQEAESGPISAEGYGFSKKADAPARTAPPGGAPPTAGTTPAPNDSPVPTGTDQTRAPLLIYDAVLTLAVFEATQAIDVIEKLAVDSGGYLVQRGDRHITIRVPTKAFRPALDKVETLGDELHREVNVKDVTEEFSDLEIRLQNARAMRARLEELLRQATNVEEALAVQKELERVTEEIERMLGRLKLLRELVAFSTITVRFEARPTDIVDSRVTLPFPWLHELGLPNLLSM